MIERKIESELTMKQTVASFHGLDGRAGDPHCLFLGREGTRRYGREGGGVWEGPPIM